MYSHVKDKTVFNLGIPILVTWHLDIETPTLHLPHPHPQGHVFSDIVDFEYGMDKTLHRSFLLNANTHISSSLNGVLFKPSLSAMDE